MIFTADKTLAAIEKAMAADQGSRFRVLLGDLMPKAKDAYREDNEFRTHLGASSIGRSCAREIWYSWHWVTKAQHDDQKLRLFNRGHLEEPRFVALLLLIGCQVWQYDETGEQFRITGHAGHYGGSLDGVVLGIPDLPGDPMLTEFKTCKASIFRQLKKKGVREAHLEHYVQMQQYMGGYGLRYALYMAVNKDTDEIYAEIIQFDAASCARFYERAGMIIAQIEAPPRISNSPGWYKCKSMCDHREVCHLDSEPERNCRTCCFSRPIEKGQWTCTNDVMVAEAETAGWEEPIYLDKEQQLEGCEHYVVNPTIKAKP